MAVIGCVERPQQQLISAALRGDLARVQRLLEQPHVDVNWQTPLTGKSALQQAAMQNQVAIVRLLLQRGANPDIATPEHQTPLQLAAYSGGTEVVQLLLEAGADPNIAETVNGYTALVSAARNGHIAVIRTLLEAGADPTVPGKDGRMAYQVARQYDHSEAEQLLRPHKP
jgi:ankyrin repeat protein